MGKVLVHFSEDVITHNDPCDCAQNKDRDWDDSFVYAYVDEDKYNDWVNTLKHQQELKRYFYDIEEKAEENNKYKMWLEKKGYKWHNGE